MTLRGARRYNLLGHSFSEHAAGEPAVRKAPILMSVHIVHTKSDSSRPDWAAVVVDELAEVERRLSSAIVSDVDAASDISAQLLHAGGKRIRPALVLLSALGIGGRPAEPRVIDLAAVVELVHMASLVHDDVIDETRERRGQATANSRWGNKLSVLGGDYLLANAFSILAAEPNPEVIRLLSSTAVRMTESELLQARAEGDVSMWQAHYLRIIRDKTANFMSACSESGAIAAGARAPERRALADYGENLGMAFQIMDDVLDIAGDPVRMGKEIGVDIRRGKFTLPVILALERLDGAERQRALDGLNRRLLTSEEALELARLVAGCGAVEEARETARNYARKAARVLERLPTSDYTDALAALSRYVVLRHT